MDSEKMKPGTRRILVTLIVFMTLLFAYNALHTYIAMEGLAFWGYPYISAFNDDADDGLRSKSYQCPRFIADWETKRVGVSITNTSDQVLTAYAQIVLSNPSVEYGVQHETGEVSLSAGETKQITWKIDGSNIRNGIFVSTRAFVSWQPAYVSNRSLSCNLLALNILDLPSNVVGFGLFILLGLATAILALSFISADPFTKRYGKPRSSVTYLLVALGIMTVGSLTGSWLLGFLMIIFILLGLLAFLQVEFR